MRKLIVLALLLCLAGCRKPALHQGKTVEQWAEGLRAADVQVRRDSVRALGALKAKGYVGPLVAALKDADEEVRSRAAEALWSIGSDAREAVPALIPLLRE